MKTAEATFLIIPGFGNSEPDHWQSRWEKKLSTAQRIIQPDWNKADRAQWAGTIAQAVNAADRPVVLITHSIGTAAVSHAAPLFAPGKVAGGFLVALSDWNREELLPGVPHDFAPLPRVPFPFPSLLVASRNDPYCDFDVAADYANAWGATLIDAGKSGHINVASGHGPWPEGLLQLAGFMQKL